MRKLLLLLTLGLTSALPALAQPTAQTITLQGTLQTQTLLSTNTYLLRGFVKVAEGAVLTIQPGTIIYGEKSTNGTLIVQRGSQIDARGTAERPIVFTSAFAQRARNPGDWGGIIVLGRASLNTPTGTSGIEGIPPSENLIYGGGTTPNDADNSGFFQYVRIEFAGIALAPNNEINGLTMGAVGSGTTLDHVMVSYSGDDSFEWFGGTVNAKYLIAYRGLDDDFDTDFGYQGRVQFAVAYRDPARADAVGSGSGGDSNGFESDNDGTGSLANPRTFATFSNVTLIGPRATAATQISPFFFRGARLRRATAQSVLNSVIAGWPVGVNIESARSGNSATNDSLQVRNVIIAGATTNFAQSSAGTFNSATFFANPAYGNRTFANNTDVLPAEAFVATQDPAAPVSVSPNPVPALTSPAATGASFASARIVAGGAFFTPTAYVGAFDPAGVRWDARWAVYNPETQNYTNGKTVANERIETADGALSLDGASPNPFGSRTSVGYTLPSAGRVRLSVFDVMGREVAVLADGVEPAGARTAAFDGAGLSSGTYFVRLQTASGAVSRAVTLVK